MIAPDGFLFVPDLLALVEPSELLHELAARPYEHQTFRGQRLKRGYAQFGYAYISTGRKLKAVPANRRLDGRPIAEPVLDGRRGAI
jgi:hypothetical protein